MNAVDEHLEPASFGYFYKGLQSVKQETVIEYKILL